MNSLLAGALINTVLICLTDIIILKFAPEAKTPVIIYSIAFYFVGIVLVTKALDWLTDKIRYSGKKNDNEYINKEEVKPIKEEAKPNRSAYKTPADDPNLDLYFGEMGPRGYSREKRVAQNNEKYEVLLEKSDTNNHSSSVYYPYYKKYILKHPGISFEEYEKMAENAVITSYAKPGDDMGMDMYRGMEGTYKYNYEKRIAQNGEIYEAIVRPGY